jgi:hypothetical protein
MEDLKLLENIGILQSLGRCIDFLGKTLKSQTTTAKHRQAGL